MCEVEYRLLWFVIGAACGMILLPSVLLAFMWVANELHEAKHGRR